MNAVDVSLESHAKLVDLFYNVVDGQLQAKPVEGTHANTVNFPENTLAHPRCISFATQNRPQYIRMDN